MKNRDKTYQKPDVVLPPHNVQVLDEYGHVVTFNHKTGKWKDTYGRNRNVKLWKFRDK